MAERQMTSTCRIYTPGAPVTDPDTGEVTYGEQNPIDTVCRVRPADLQGAHAEAGGAELVTSAFIVSVPFNVTGVRKNSRLRVTSSPDPALVGVVMEVQAPPFGDNLTARRLPCDLVS